MTQETPRTEAEQPPGGWGHSEMREQISGKEVDRQMAAAAPPEPPRPKDVERLAKLLESNYGSLVYNDDWQADARAFLEEVAAPQGQPLDVERLVAAVLCNMEHDPHAQGGPTLPDLEEPWACQRHRAVARSEIARVLSESGSPR